jgi:peptide/nickel transport system permease protein
LVSELAISLPDFKSYTHLLLLDSLLNGRLDIFWDVARHLILPVFALTIISSAQLVRVMRSSMLEALGQDYVRTARAKGLANRRVVYKHALRNAMIPVLTLAGLVLFGLLGGVVITETVFNYPGLGNWSAKAAVQLDIPAVLGYAMFSALVVSVANLVVDVTYGLVDPRIRYQ